MPQGNTRVARIRYNLEFSGYEAVVFVHEAGDIFSYPSFVPAPLDAEYALVMKRLANTALKQHRSANPGLRSHIRRMTPAAQQNEQPPLAA